MSESAPAIPAAVAAMVEAAELDARPDAAATMTEAGGGWFGTELAGKAVRLAIAVWAAAVNGDESALAAITGPDTARFLLNPVGKKWVVAPGPVVTTIDIWGVEPSAEPPRLNAEWRFTGRQQYAGPAVPQGGRAWPGSSSGCSS